MITKKKIEIWGDDRAIEIYDKEFEKKFREIQSKGEEFDDIIEAFRKGKEAANNWLQNKYKNGRMNNIAQTRISASYGFLQMLYSTAKLRGYKYDQSHRPEDLEETETIFTFAVPYLRSKLSIEINTQLSKENSEWNLGFEQTVYNSLSLYNSPSLEGNPERMQFDYSSKVIKYARKYLPTKK